MFRYRWIKGILAAAILCAPFTAHSQDEAPPNLREAAELATFRNLLEDQQRALDALREYDLAQQTLSDWDLEIAEELAMTGEGELAEEKVNTANRRILLVRTAYEMFLEHYPKNPYALNYYGEIMFDHFGDEALGLQRWQTAAALAEDYAAPRNNLALFYSHRGNYELAFRYMDETLERDGRNPDYLFNAAQLYLIHFPQLERMKGWDKEKIYNKAMDMSRRAAEAIPDDYQLASDYAVNFFAAVNFDLEPDWKKAAAAWEKAREAAIDRDDVFYTWLNEARVWTEAGEWAKAENAVNEALVLIPGSNAAKIILEKIKTGQAAETN